MGVKRLLLTAVVVLAASVVLIPGAGAGNFDEQRMGCSGENPATCPTGTEGQPYSMKVYLLGDEDLGCAVFSVSSGSLPPGLTLSSEGTISGTPTQAGSFNFFLTVTYNAQPTCLKPTSDDRFIIPINPGIPKLTLGPEQSSVPSSTVGAPFSLQMTANLSDAKTWSIVEGSGSLPPGVQLGATDGLISGTPTTAGTYTFTVRGALTSDASRSDTKTLAIVVRDPLAITADDLFEPETNLARTEIGVNFNAVFAATGGSGTNTWAITGGTAPPGLLLSETGAVTGQPTTTGRYGFTVAVTDSEGRTAAYNAVVSVAARLAILTRTLRPGRVLQAYRQKIATTGGVDAQVRVKRGPLPKGLRFDRTLGVLSGTPLKAGTWRIDFEALDSLRVKTTRTLLIRIVPAKKRARPRG